MKNFIFTLLFLCPIVLFSQTTLEKAKESLSDKNSTSSSGAYSSNANYESGEVSRNNNDNSFFLGIFGEIAFYTFYGAFIGNAEYRAITPHPYFNNLKGEYLKDVTIQSKTSLFKLGVNRLYNSDVKAFEVNANYRMLPILGIEASHSNFSDNSIHGKGYLDVSSLMLNYYRVRERGISLWWGLGASYVGNEVNTFGFAYNAGVEVFPIKPISLSANYKQSFINSNTINQVKLHIKYHIKNVGLYTGFHSNELGGENVNGLIIGAEYTF
ncbi:MAG: hypothetical protein KBE41_06675 [Lutibacter sp.]|nr:hypothetical protein [Lutibacter sp.]MBP9601168.1 hypothetical protein [Lutibacter sp.]